MTVSLYMRYPLVIRPLAPVEYEALLAHCTECPSCLSAPDRECPFAAGLRRTWSAAGRAARGGGR